MPSTRFSHLNRNFILAGKVGIWSLAPPLHCRKLPWRSSVSETIQGGERNEYEQKKTHRHGGGTRREEILLSSMKIKERSYTGKQSNTGSRRPSMLSIHAAAHSNSSFASAS